MHDEMGEREKIAVGRVRSKAKRKTSSGLIIKNNSPDSGPANPNVTSPGSLEDFLEALVKGVKSLPTIETLSEKDQTAASTLLAIFTDPNFIPESLDSLKYCPEKSLGKLIKVTHNFHFITAIFIQFNDYPISEVALRKILKNFAMAPNFLSAVAEHSGKVYFQDLLIRVAEGIRLNTEEFRLARWLLIFYMNQESLFITTRLSLWTTYSGKSEEFFELPPNMRSTILKKLISQPQLLLNFLFTLEMHKTSNTHLRTINKIIDSISINSILVFALEKIEVSPRNFLESLFAVGLRKKLNQLSNIEDCLPFLMIETIFPGFLGDDSIERAWQRCAHRTSGLVTLFRNRNVEELTRQAEDQLSKLVESQTALQESLYLSESRESENIKLRAVLASYEVRFRERVEGQGTSQNAVERQVKIDLLRQFVDHLDPEITRTHSDGLLIALRQMGINRVGKPGEALPWNQMTCESLTGAEIDNPIVIRSGYTWSSGSETHTLVKALVKPNR